MDIGETVIVSMRDVVVSYQRADGETVKAVDHVTLDIKDGEFLTLIGPSGCGKTSLLHTIGGLLQPESGEVLVDGVAMRGPQPKRCAYIFQDFALFPWRTAVANVEIALELGGVPKSNRRDRAMDALERVGLSEFANRYPRELSGGMKQRVAVARALVSDADVLLLDEPFGAVDEQTRLVLGTELCRILESSGKTVVFVTHSLQEAAYLSDRVVALSRGPARIREIFDVGLERPRTPKMMASQGFQGLQSELFSVLFDESKAGNGS